MLRPASGPSCRNRANGGVSRRMRPQLRTGRSVSPERWDANRTTGGRSVSRLGSRCPVQPQPPPGRLGPSSRCERFRPLPARKRPPVLAGWLSITAAIWAPKAAVGPGSVASTPR
jgi:hypothetical protein